MSERWGLGVDIGSVTVKFLLLDEERTVRLNTYRRTMGDPLNAMISGLDEVREALGEKAEIGAVGTTGSGRHLAGAFLGADIIKNEITAHAIGALNWRRDLRTIIEIGGQDSKIIHIRDGMVVDFAMNTVCAAGTGAFLDQQAIRLQIEISEFGRFSLGAKRSARISGRCAVFAESDMIHKQQVGWDKAEICFGLCQALVRNYLNNVARGKRLHSPISFQGGVACNDAIVRCFRDVLPNAEIVVPPLLTGCGALGAALLALDEVGDRPTAFRGWQGGLFATTQHYCEGCINECEIFSLLRDGKVQGRWGGRCQIGNALERPRGTGGDGRGSSREDRAFDLGSLHVR